MMYVIYCVLLYFYIGYTYVCWIAYREGAGFNIHGVAIATMDEAWPAVMILWPLAMIVHMGCVVYDKFNLEKTVHRISPYSFRKRGEHDNNADVQAEKYLLGGK